MSRSHANRKTLKETHQKSSQTPGIVSIPCKNKNSFKIRTSAKSKKKTKRKKRKSGKRSAQKEGTPSPMTQTDAMLLKTRYAMQTSKTVCRRDMGYVEGLSPVYPFFAPSITSYRSWHCARFVRSLVRCSYILTRVCVYVCVCVCVYIRGGEDRFGNSDALQGADRGISMS